MLSGRTKTQHSQDKTHVLSARLEDHDLSEIVDIGGLEVLMPEKVIAKVGTTERLRSGAKDKPRSIQELLSR